MAVRAGPRSFEPGISRVVVDAVSRTLVALGYDKEKRAAPPARAPLVPGSLADDVLDDASSALGDHALGLTLARRIPIGALGDLDYSLCTSATLKEGLARLARYYGAVTERVTLSLVEGPPSFLLFERRPRIVHSRHWIEFSFAIIAERIRQTVGAAVRFDEVSFSHPGPPDTRAYDAFFGAPVAFAQPADRLGFAGALLDRPLLTAAGALAEVLEQKMREIAQPLGAGDDALLLRARRVILEALDEGESGVDITALRLHVSRRTLQRELKARGTSHQKLVDDVRRERAQALLENDGTTVAEVSRALAFSEPSAFFRAFRRWTGMSPRSAAGAPPAERGSAGKGRVGS